MNRAKQSIILIGMPGAGKSTIGILLAKELGLDFVDTDVTIQVEQGKTLQEINDTEGYLVLRRYEQQVLLNQELESKVVATGGSAVYSEAGMLHLQANGLIVFLDVSLQELERRVTNFATRGLARRPDQSFSDLFIERSDLYKRYADISIECSNLSVDEALHAIISALDDCATINNKGGGL